ncbi:MAG: zf-HC2 domain-containing protein [Candidatus Latescibacterota bacterium]|nr:MAG: zf-HC2 domain-containing protein [Candidatus Latescibacterota bacterium]
MNVYDDTTRCEWARDSIDAYLDGELTKVDVAALESHLEMCGGCRNELESARRILFELRELPEQRCPDGVTDHVYETIGADTTVQRKTRFPGWLSFPRTGLLRPALAGTLILVISISVVWIGFKSRSSVRSPVYTPEQVAQAEAELKWTMAFLGDVGRRAGYAVRDEAVGTRVIDPMRRAVHPALENGAADPTHNNGG